MSEVPGTRIGSQDDWSAFGWHVRRRLWRTARASSSGAGHIRRRTTITAQSASEDIEMSVTLSKLIQRRIVRARRKRENHDFIGRRSVWRTVRACGALAPGYRAGQRSRRRMGSLPIAGPLEPGQRRGRVSGIESLGNHPFFAEVSVGIAVAAIGEQRDH